MYVHLYVRPTSFNLLFLILLLFIYLKVEAENFIPTNCINLTNESVAVLDMLYK